MGQCKQQILISTIYDCATFCEKWNDAPIPKINISKNFLIQDSQFFDSGIIQNRRFKWLFSSRDYLFYETDWGGMSEFILDMNNGSTYSSLKLGVNHAIILNFLNSLPNTILTTSDPITVQLKIKDCDGFENNIESNKYKFNKK